MVSITTPLRPRSSALANPLADFDNLLATLHLMLLGMKKRDQNWIQVGSLTTRLAARLVARRQADLAGGRELHPPESGEDSATRRPEKKGPTYTGQGGRGECPRLGENVIQFTAESWGLRGDRPRQSHGRPAPSVSADPFNAYSVPAKISTARGSRNHASHSGYILRTVHFCSACKIVV